MNRTKAAGGAGLAFTVAMLAGCGSGGSKPTRTEFNDQAGRHCTQVTANLGGRVAVALDCDYPPAENRIGDALNGLVNP